MINQELDNVLSLRVQVTNDIRQMAQHFFMPPISAKPQDPKDPAMPEFMRKMADGAGAVELVCSLMNVFGVMAGLKNYSGESAIADLTFSLNLNQFWVKNAANLMPIVSAAINAFQDNQKLKLKNEPLWSHLEQHNRMVWLEVLPAVLMCLKGAAAMREQSLELKQSFEKFLRVN